MKVGDEGELILDVEDIQQAVVDWLVGRGLAVPGRPHTVAFDVALFPDPEDPEAIQAIVRETSQA